MGTEKQKRMVSITFLFTSEGHEAFWELEYCFSGSLTFSQGQIPTHTDTVWSETFASVPQSFLTRPDANSHRQGPFAGSNRYGVILFFFFCVTSIGIFIAVAMGFT
jgi:hypothetical protein